jgi:hypothetical protein
MSAVFSAAKSLPTLALMSSKSKDLAVTLQEGEAHSIKISLTPKRASIGSLITPISVVFPSTLRRTMDNVCSSSL